MATANKTAAPKPAVTDRAKLPFGANAEVLDELQILDKAELVGKPFIIETVMVYTNDRNIEHMDVDIRVENGETFTFKDSSSTGVKHQILGALAGKGVELTAGELYDFPVPIFCPEGLRVSHYEVEDHRGAKKMARTFYLTTSGKRKR